MRKEGRGSSGKGRSTGGSKGTGRSYVSKSAKLSGKSARPRLSSGKREENEEGGRSERPSRGFGRRESDSSDERPGRTYGRRSSGDSETRPTRSYTRRPSGDSEERPSRGASRRESDSSDERPGRTYGRRPSGDSEARPTRSYTRRPSGDSEERPSRGASRRESDSSDERPGRTYGRRPSGDSEERPSRGASRRESDSSDERPGRTYGRRPSGDADERPSRGASRRDTGSSDERPGRTYGRRPSGDSDERPARSYNRRSSGGSDDRPKRPYNSDRPAGRGGSRPAPRGKSFSRKAASTISDSGQTRLNKFISNCGICSRREADELIKAGVISVNGNIITEMGYKVNPGDEVRYNNELLRGERPVYLLLNKPKDFITTVEDPGNRRTVMELIANACKERVYPVGRLDRNTTGVLLFTNDGELARKLMHPSFEVQKIYHVSLDKSFSPENMEKVLKGIHLEDGPIKADDIAYAGEGTDRKEVGIELHSGRNRIVRRIFEHFGHEVLKLDRTVFAGLTKKDLPRGRWRFLKDIEVAHLKMLVGDKHFA